MSDFAMTRTCGECPWRRDVPTGRFPPERFRDLARTCEQDLRNPVFACHKTERQEKACAGFLIVEGWNNIRVRLAASQGAFDPAEISAAGPLFDSYAEMAAANGWLDASRWERRRR